MKTLHYSFVLRWELSKKSKALNFWNSLCPFSPTVSLYRATRGGAGGTMTPGPMRGPLVSVGPAELERGPSKRHWEIAWRTFFFFWDHLFSTAKTARISMKTFFFFFEDHIINRTKMRHFLHLFLSSKNRKFVIFELAPGPRSAWRPVSIWSWKFGNDWKGAVASAIVQNEVSPKNWRSYIIDKVRVFWDLKFFKAATSPNWKISA